ELGEHERAGLGVGAHTMQRSGMRIEHPVVAPCILAPHFFSVREDEQMASILRPLVVVDLQWSRRWRWTKQSRRYQDLSRASACRVLHDIGPTGNVLRRFECGVVRAIVSPACWRGSIASVRPGIEDPVERRINMCGKLPVQLCRNDECSSYRRRRDAHHAAKYASPA